MAQIKSWGTLKAKAEQVTDLINLQRDLADAKRELQEDQFLSDDLRHATRKKVDHLNREIAQREQEMNR